MAVEMDFEESLALSQDFIYSEDEMINLPTLFKNHLSDLPRLCMVAEGIYGPTSYNDVSSGQLLWLETYSTQERVIVRDSADAKKVQLRHLSIPLDFDGKFRVVYSINKMGEERSLREIVEGRQLPVQICYTRPGRNAVPTESKLPRQSNMLLIKQHNDYYFLGNCLLRDQASSTPTVIMMEPDISVCYIKGRKSMSEAEFNKYIHDMKTFLHRECIYDRTCGYPEIVDIVPDEMRQNDGRITIPKPPTGESIMPLSEAYFTNDDDRAPIPGPRVQRDQYDELEVIESLKKEAPAKPLPEPKKKPSPEVLPKTPLKKKVLDIFKGKSVSKSEENVNKSQVPRQDYESFTSRETEDEDYYEVVGDIVPECPPIPPRQTKNATDEKKQVKKKFDGSVEKDIRYQNTQFGRAEVKPLTKSKTDADAKKPTTVGAPSKVTTKNPVIGGAAVKDFTITEVASALSLLGLDMHIDAFKKEQMDGVILAEMDIATLKSDFKFSHAQAVRLMKYVENGHIPK